MLNESVVTQIDSLTGVFTSSPQLSTTAYVNGGSTLLYGIDSSTYSTVTNGLAITNGTMLSSSSANDSIILSSTLAQSLGATVGSSVVVGQNSTGGADYTVIGIYTPTTTFGPLATSAYVSLSNAQGISGEVGKVTEVYVKATAPGVVSTVASEITSSLSDVRAITSSSLTAPAATLSSTLTTFFTVIGLVALLAGGFGVINTMMMSISERTREIGTLRAIGARKGQVMRIFMSEAFLIGVIVRPSGFSSGLLLRLPCLTSPVR